MKNRFTARVFLLANGILFSGLSICQITSITITPDSTQKFRVYLLTAQKLSILDKWDDATDTLLSVNAPDASNMIQSGKWVLLSGRVETGCAKHAGEKGKTMKIVFYNKGKQLYEIVLVKSYQKDINALCNYINGLLSAKPDFRIRYDFEIYKNWENDCK